MISIGQWQPRTELKVRLAGKWGSAIAPLLLTYTSQPRRILRGDFPEVSYQITIIEIGGSPSLLDYLPF